MGPRQGEKVDFLGHQNTFIYLRWQISYIFFTAAFLYCLEKLIYIVETGLLLVLIGIKSAVQLLYTDSGLAHLWSRWAVTVAKWVTCLDKML